MENLSNTLNSTEESELTLKDVFIEIKKIYLLFKRQFWKIFIFSLVGGLLGFAFAYFSKPTYSAKIRFLMKEAGGSSSLMSSLGSLGALFGGSGAASSPLDRTIEILGSERIVGAALLKPLIVNRREDLAINHLILIEELDKDWKEDSILNGISFSPEKSELKKMDFAERKAYKSIVNLLTSKKTNKLEYVYDKKSGVFDLIVKSVNEDFSIEFTKALYKELEQFMYNQSVNPSGKNVEIITSKIDSIKSALDAVQNTLARKTDRTLGLLMQEDKVEQKKLLMKEQMLTIMYAEAQKNLETFKFLNESINTGFEILEYPYSPIKPNKRGRVTFFVLSFLIAGFFYFIYLNLKEWFLKEV